MSISAALRLLRISPRCRYLVLVIQPVWLIAVCQGWHSPVEAGGRSDGKAVLPRAVDLFWGKS